MRRSFALRIAALAIGLLVGGSAPGLALAHGYAHHEAREHASHDREHHHAADVRDADESHDALIPSVRGEHESRDHDHPQIGQGASAKPDTPLGTLPRDQSTLPSKIAFVRTASLLLIVAPARAGPLHAPPRQPRAPPLG